jgi:predicted TIM-barrel fold metal-dependent hydrolase
MTRIPECLPPVRETRKASLAVPAGSGDCHTHIFVDGYPLIPERGYTPPESNLDHMLQMHFGYMPAKVGVEHPPFRALLDLVGEGNTWVKLSAPNRVGVGDLPPWPSVVPMAKALIAANPERILWGTDWPHPNKFELQPNDADLLEQLGLWAPDDATRNRILVANPVALYDF